MKILFVIPSMAGGGGAERVMSILSNELSRCGNTVLIAQITKDDRKPYETDENIKVVNCYNEKRKKSIFSIFSSTHRLIKLIKKEKPDIVISFITIANLCSIIASKLTGTKVIVSERNNPYLVPSNKLFRKIRDIIYKHADGYVFQTEYARAYYLQKRIKNPNAVIYNPVSDQVLKYRNAQKRNSIIAACRLEPQKNLALLVNAFAKIHATHPNVILEIYGEGSEFEALKKMIETLELSQSAYLCGRSNEVIKKMSEASIFVLSSDFEGMPNSLIEAMCVGTACVATDSPTYGCRELISNGINGYLCPVNDVDAMVECIESLLRDPNIMRLFENESVKLINKVSKEKIIMQWNDFIKSVMEA